MEEPKSTLLKLPRIDLGNFTVNGRRADETIAEFIERNRITDEQLAWVEAQPLRGKPSLRRLRAAFAGAGFEDISLQLSDDHQDLEFRVRLTPNVNAEDSESLVRLWIKILRSSGFCVGFSEAGITDLAGAVAHGTTLTDNSERLYHNGAPAIEQENDDGHD